MEYKEGEDFEKTIAAKFDHPYEFKILKSEMVGTNDCAVIARTMIAPLSKAEADIFYDKYPLEKRAELGTEYIRTETDFYFRKSDGVTFGLTMRNRAGELLDDYVYDSVEINQPIPDREFSLPKGDIKIAKSFDECMKIVGELRAAKLAKTRQNPTATLSEKRVSELPWATDLPKALEQAKAENKIVLLDFTGSDWCVWCIKFDDDVLSQPEFASYAKTNLVMIMLDFPNAIKQTEAQKKSNQELQAKFKVDGFPTYVALTPDGKEIGRQVGYLAGGPPAFIAELGKFRKQ
jgi:thioredoxin-related protein